MNMTAGNDEREPLISASGENNGSGYTTNNSPDIDYADTIADNSRIVSPETYAIVEHTERQGNAKRGYGAVPTSLAIQSAQFTYTWNDINCFTATEEQSKGKGGFFSCCSRRRSKQLTQRKQILKNVNGEAKPGELLAIMGSSGAGKTTLLNTLTFRSTKGIIVSGTRALNGRLVNATDLAALSAYVQQDDLFIGTLTVREHLIFHAMVRMDKRLSYGQRIKRVEEVLTELSLRKCENTQIGIPGRVKGISGGERKRLSFASEVLTDPPLMFCDEPTSGLDSFMAQNVIQVLKGMAQKGKTIISTIHQPSSEVFAMFDKLLLMAEGRVAFLGPTDRATEFFRDLGAICPENYNPGDFFIQVLAVVPSREESSKKAIDTICDGFQNSEEGRRLQLQAENVITNGKKKHLEEFGTSPKGRSPYKVNWCAQFRAVFWRSWLSVVKEPMLVKVRLLQTLGASDPSGLVSSPIQFKPEGDDLKMVSLIVGVIYFGQEVNQDGVMNINGAMFIFLTNMTFQNVFSVINVFCSEISVFLREHRSGLYRTDVYFLCKTLAETPIYAMIPTLFTCVAYYMIGMNPEQPRFFITAGIVILVANVATSFGYLISCASKNISMALAVGPPVIIPFMLFGGFFLNNGSVPEWLLWLSKLSWFRYANEALLINQWSGVENIPCTRTNSSCPSSGKIVLETLNFSEDDFLMDILCLVALIVVFRFFAYLALLARTYRKE